MWLAKQVTMIRLSGLGREDPPQRRRRPSISDSVKPGSSALVESDSSRRMPSVAGQRPDAGQVGAPAVDRV